MTNLVLGQALFAATILVFSPSPQTSATSFKDVSLQTSFSFSGESCPVVVKGAAISI